MKKLFLIAICTFVLGFAFAKDLTAFNNLSDEDKIYSILSSTLMQVNSQDHDFLNPETTEKSGTSELVLRRDWGITSVEDLDRNLKTMTETKTGKSSVQLRELLKKNAKKSASQLVRTEMLNYEEAYDLFVVSYFDKEIGNLCELAWRYGRCITIIRWALAAGYINEETAREKAKPFADELRKSYNDFEDFASHYLMGALFFHGTAAVVQKRFDATKKFYEEYRDAFPKDLFELSSENKKSKNPVYTFAQFQKFLDGFKKIENSDDAKKIYELRTFTKNLQQENVIGQLDLFEAERKSNKSSVYNSPFYFYFVNAVLIETNLFYDYGAQYLNGMEKVITDKYKDTDMYKEIYYNYLVALVYSKGENDYLLIPSIVKKFDESFENIGFVHYAYATYFALKISQAISNRTLTDSEAGSLSSQGKKEMEAAEKAGFVVPDILKIFYSQFN